MKLEIVLSTFAATVDLIIIPYSHFLGLNSIKFGAVGTITGVLDELIEVYFDVPFIGGTNLGGRCTFFHGAIVKFVDIFNLTRWNKIPTRVKNDDFYGWNLIVFEFRPNYNKSKVIAHKDIIEQVKVVSKSKHVEKSKKKSN